MTDHGIPFPSLIICSLSCKMGGGWTRLEDPTISDVLPLQLSITWENMLTIAATRQWQGHLTGTPATLIPA